MGCRRALLSCTSPAMIRSALAAVCRLCPYSTTYDYLLHARCRCNQGPREVTSPLHLRCSRRYRLHQRSHQTTGRREHGHPRGSWSWKKPWRSASGATGCAAVHGCGSMVAREKHERCAMFWSAAPRSDALRTVVAVSTHCGAPAHSLVQRSCVLFWLYDASATVCPARGRLPTCCSAIRLCY